MKSKHFTKALSTLLIVSMLVVAFAFTASAEECSGTHIYVDGFCTVENCGAIEAALPKDNGTVDDLTDDYYAITNAGNLYWFAQQVAAGNTGYNAKLTEDIYVNRDYIFNTDGTYNLEEAPLAWTMIGSGDNKYAGVFDGNGKSVNGLYINDSLLNYVGVFGAIDTGATVKNLTINNSYFCGKDKVGGVCGMSNGSIINCTNNGTVFGNNTIGGICAYSYGSITGCTNNGSVSGALVVGGICGNIFGNTVIECVNNGSVLAGYVVGGVCGISSFDNTTKVFSEISKCVNTGTITCTPMVTLYSSYSGNRAGGICGYNGAILKSSYNTGNVNGENQVGGVCGYNGTGVNNGPITMNSYNTGNVNGDSQVGGICGSNSCEVAYCYSTGTIYGTVNVGAIAGDNLTADDISYCYYRSGCAKDSTNTTQQGVGTNYKGSYKTNVANCTISASLDRFADGSVTYGLNNKVIDGTQAWYQNISGDNTDDYPTLDSTHKAVYFVKYDDNGFIEYHVDPIEYTNYQYFQSAIKTTDKYDINGDEIYDIVYEITNAGQFYWFAEFANTDTSANAILLPTTGNTFNLNLNHTFQANGSYSGELTPRTWTPIGTSDKKYSGNFNGNGITISGLYIGGSQDYVGLFGYTSENAIIKDITVDSSYICGSQFVGTVCGYNEGTISNCINNSAVFGNSTVGGVCGQNEGDVIKCRNTGIIIGTNHSGGVCGDNNKHIDNCFNTGSISGEIAIGGICGKNTFNISNCYNVGGVIGTEYVGSVCGYNIPSGIITNCYYLIHSAKYVNNQIQQGIGAAANDTCYDIENVATLRFDEEFANGSVTYALNGGDEQINPLIWYQTVGTGLPGFVGDVVYYGYMDCSAEGKKYANTMYYDERPSHIFGEWSIFNDDEHIHICTVCATDETEIHSFNQDGFCTVCGAYKPATYTTDKYDIDGNHTNDIVYEIASAGELFWFAKYTTFNDCMINAILIKDIDLNKDYVFNEDGGYDHIEAPRTWSPIVYGYAYEGVFDGNGHTISGLYINDEHEPTGLFFGIAPNGVVRNLRIDNSYFYGNVIGSVCCFNSGIISNCSSDATLRGIMYVGGICGNNDTGSVFNCYNTGFIFGTEYVGGICGNNDIGSIANCYNTGSVSGTEYVGGICGSSFNGYVVNCYNTGFVSGDGKIGALCGSVGLDYLNGNVKNNYYLSGSAVDNEGNECIGAGYTISDMVLVDATGIIEEKNADQFADGSVTYALNGGEHQESPLIWYQTIGTGLPDFTGEVVYYGYENCLSIEREYSNTAYSYTQPEHTYGEYTDNENGYHTRTCYICGTKKTESHNIIYRDNNDDTHSCACSICNYVKIENHSYGFWADNQDGTHFCKCVYCMRYFAQDHSCDEEGFCTVCDGYSIATKTIGKYDFYPHIEDIVYEISSVGELYWFAQQVNNGYTNYNAILVNDIIINKNYVINTDGTYSGDDLPRMWNPIGINSLSYPDSFYSGIFEGNNHTISGLYINESFSGDISYMGLFAAIGTNGCVRKLNIESSYIYGNEFVGSICGYNKGEIYCCTNSGTVIGVTNIGGICGSNEGVIQDCYNVGLVTGNANIGGVVGTNSHLLSNCYYLDNCAKDLYGNPMGGIGLQDNNTITSFCESKTTEQFASGEVAWLLDTGGIDNIYHNHSGIWSQGDNYPIFSGDANAVIYKITIVGAISETEYSGANGKAISLPDGYTFTLSGLPFTSETVVTEDIEIQATVAPAITKGDIDGDGEITPADISLAIAGRLGNITLTAEQTEAADVDGDGELTPNDISLLIAYRLGTVATFPIPAAPRSSSMPELVLAFEKFSKKLA